MVGWLAGGLARSLLAGWLTGGRAGLVAGQVAGLGCLGGWVGGRWVGGLVHWRAGGLAGCDVPARRIRRAGTSTSRRACACLLAGGLAGWLVTCRSLTPRADTSMSRQARAYAADRRLAIVYVVSRDTMSPSFLLPPSSFLLVLSSFLLPPSSFLSFLPSFPPSPSCLPARRSQGCVGHVLSRWEKLGPDSTFYLRRVVLWPRITQDSMWTGPICNRCGFSSCQQIVRKKRPT